MDVHLRHGCRVAPLAAICTSLLIAGAFVPGCATPSALSRSSTAEAPPALATTPVATPEVRHDVQRPVDSPVLESQADGEAEQSPDTAAPPRAMPSNVLRIKPQASAVAPASYDDVQLDGPGEAQELLELPTPKPDEDKIAEPLVPLPEAATQRSDDRFPLNLGTALQLAGANNLQIAIAAERVEEAMARLAGAEVLWIPSLNAGVGYNNHAGRIQATEGEIVEASRDSLFVGGGAVLSGAPLTGGAGGPARLVVDINPVDIYFEPLAARQTTARAEAGAATTFNDTLLEVTLVYFELLQAQFDVAIAEEAAGYAQKLVDLTTAFASAGAGLEADVQRATAELAQRRQDVLAAEERVFVVSSELARLLRLPQDTALLATDVQPVPLHMFPVEAGNLSQLIAEALVGRPELAQFDAHVGETFTRVRQEHLRPFIPSIHLGMSAGGFGGGGGREFGNFGDRTDFDALAVWELRNFGLGNRALVRERESQLRQAHLALEQAQDLVAAEVAKAFRQVEFRRQQVDRGRDEVAAAAKAIPLNFAGIRGRELRAIEAQQAIRALADARGRYLSAVVRYNQAQFALLRAVGRPPQPSTAEEIPLPVEGEEFIVP